MTNLEKLVNAVANAEQALHAGIIEEYPLGSVVRYKDMRGEVTAKVTGHDGRSLVMDKIRRSFDKVSR